MLRPIQPYVEYVLNQNYIAEFLCINKDKPELICNGKCHLMKQIEKQQASDPFTTLRICLENYPIGFVNIQRILPFQHILSPKGNSKFNINLLYSFHYQNLDIEPPELM